MQYLEYITSPVRLLVMITCLCCNITLMSFQACASDEQITPPIQVEIDNGVVYCSIGSVLATESIQHALKEGTSITFRWTFTIEEVSIYWINSHVGSVSVNRQVIPDLVSRTWILKDGSTGIEKRVFSFDQAMQFLLHIKRFPVLDQSLLQANNEFSMRVDLYIDEGDIDTSWWVDMVRFDSISNTQKFTLP